MSSKTQGFLLRKNFGQNARIFAENARNFGETQDARKQEIQRLHTVREIAIEKSCKITIYYIMY